MKNYMILVLGCALLACQGAGKVVEDSGPTVADVLAQEESSPPPSLVQTEPALHRRAASGFVPASHDTRSTEQLAIAACMGVKDAAHPDGWRCDTFKRPTTFATSGSQPIIPSSWLVPLWVIDPAKSVPCANDNNSGTSATCVGGCVGSVCTGGIGPLVTMNELIVHRWGTSSPMLQQTTDVWPISSETVGQERIRPLTPIMANAGSNFELICTPTPIGSTFAGGVVTATSRVNPGTDLKIATMPAGAAAGVLVQNISHPSYALIHSMSGATATMDQPLNGTTVVTLPYNIAENNSWTTGDTLQMLQPCLLNLTSENVQMTDTDAGLSNGIAWNSMIHVPDVSGVTGNSITILQGQGAGYWGMSVFDTNVQVANIASPAQAYSMAGCQFNGGVSLQGISALNLVALIGGDMSSNFNGFGYGQVYDDIILTGFVTLSGQNFVSGHIASGGTLDVTEGSSFIEEGSGGNTIGLWGAGTLIAKAGASFMNATGSTWVANVKVATMELADANGTAQTTGTSYATSVWTDGVTINPTNLDANNGGLQNPRTGARFARQ